MVATAPPDGNGRDPSTVFFTRDFGRQLLLLALTFLLTGIVGAFISDRFQHAMAIREAELAAMQADIAQSMAAFQIISDAVDRREFRTNRLAQSYYNKIDDATRADWVAQYRQAFAEWNENEPRHAALHAFYFNAAGVRDCKGFGAIDKRFSQSQKEAQRLFDGEQHSARALGDLVRDQDACIAIFEKSMLDSMRRKREAYLERIKQ